jgi:hypothetical protein
MGGQSSLIPTAWGMAWEGLPSLIPTAWGMA